MPASRLKKEPRDSNRDISDLLDKGSYTPEARSWSNTSLCVADSKQDMAADFATRGRRRLPFIGGINVRLAHKSPGKPAAGAGSKHIGSY